METMKIIEIERMYKNEGQHKEQCARYTLTGQVVRADNVKATDGADVLDIQIKSARASICKGTNIESHLQSDKAARYGYITKDFVMYIMNKAEYQAFVENFSSVERESKKNGGAEKLRFKTESKNMVAWLESHVA